MAVAPVAWRGAVRSDRPRTTVAFTNPESDATGVEVVDPAYDKKTMIPLDLDPADDPNNPLYNTVQDNPDYSDATYLEAHNAGGMCSTRIRLMAPCMPSWPDVPIR